MEPTPSRHSTDEASPGCLWCKRHYAPKRKTTDKTDAKGKEVLEKAEFIPPSPPSIVATPLQPHIHPEWKEMPPVRPQTPRLQDMRFDFKDEKSQNVLMTDEKYQLHKINLEQALKEKKPE